MRDLDKYSTVPATRRTLNRLMTENALLRLNIADFNEVTDTSGGSVEGPMKSISMQKRGAFEHATNASDMVTQASFTAAVEALLESATVLANTVNQIAEPLSLPAAIGAGGVGYEIEAIPALVGTAGVAEDAQPRIEGNAALMLAASAISTAISTFNGVAGTFQQNRISDAGSGNTFSNRDYTDVAAEYGDPVDATGDALSLEHAEEQIEALTDNIAFVAAKIGEFVMWANANKGEVPVEPEPEPEA